MWNILTPISFDCCMFLLQFLLILGGVEWSQAFGGLALGIWLRMHFVWVSWQTWFSVTFMCKISTASFKPAKHRVEAILRLSVQFSAVTLLFSTLGDPTDCSTSGLPVHHQLPEFTQTHDHWLGDAIQPSHLLSSLLLQPSIIPSIRVFSNESILHIRWPKYIWYTKNKV